jgi:catechol 2,3-dioxygenase-like lactoylglutathione lyase family enzyme
MSAKVRGLGHIGFYVQDLDLMKDFYAKVMVMTLTKVSPIGAFFSSDPFVETPVLGSPMVSTAQPQVASSMLPFTHDQQATNDLHNNPMSR